MPTPPKGYPARSVDPPSSAYRPDPVRTAFRTVSGRRARPVLAAKRPVPRKRTVALAPGRDTDFSDVLLETNHLSTAIDLDRKHLIADAHIEVDQGHPTRDTRNATAEATPNVTRRLAPLRPAGSQTRRCPSPPPVVMRAFEPSLMKTQCARSWPPDKRSRRCQEPGGTCDLAVDGKPLQEHR